MGDESPRRVGVEKRIMHDHITTRHAQLVAARHANAIRIQQLRGALAQAEQQDYGLAIALGEIERLLPELSAPAPAPNSDEASDAVQP